MIRKRGKSQQQEVYLLLKLINVTPSYFSLWSLCLEYSFQIFIFRRNTLLRCITTALQSKIMKFFLQQQQWYTNKKSSLNTVNYWLIPITSREQKSYRNIRNGWHENRFYQKKLVLNTGLQPILLFGIQTYYTII